VTIVVDESVSLAVALRLRALGHVVLAIAEGATAGLGDAEVFALACAQRAILVTRDRGFTKPLRYAPAEVGAILFIRPGNLPASEEVGLVERFLTSIPIDRFAGRLVTLTREGARIRE
jgi:predicted nuclease of predicted toxin-antitoxin system